jgi:hypothetical protein
MDSIRGASAALATATARPASSLAPAAASSALASPAAGSAATAAAATATNTGTFIARLADAYRRAVLQSVGSVDHDLIAHFEPALDGGVGFSESPCLNHSHLDRTVLVYQINEGPLLPVLNRYGRNNDLVAERVDQQANVDELIRE